MLLLSGEEHSLSWQEFLFSERKLELTIPEQLFCGTEQSDCWAKLLLSEAELLDMKTLE
jgi:hypothetical protein